MPLTPGPIPPIYMDLRQWNRWTAEQSIVPDNESVVEATLGDGAVTFAKMQDISTDTVIGRTTAGSGDPEEITFSALVDELEALVWEFSANIGFHGVAATAQQTTPSSLSLATVSGTGDDANINSNFSAIQSAVNAIKTALDNKGLTG